MTTLTYRVFCLIQAGDSDAAVIAGKLGQPIKRIRVVCKDLRFRRQIINVGTHKGGRGRAAIWQAAPGAVVPEDDRGRHSNTRRNLALGAAASARRNAKAAAHLPVPQTLLERCWRLPDDDR